MLAPTLDLLAARSDLDRVAVVVDVRGGRLFDQLEAAVAEVIARGVDLKILFLESSDEALVRRFESNRRPHPLQAQGGLLDGIHRERALLGDLRADADLVVDTSHRTIHELRRAITASFESAEPVRLRATVMSFGFKYGVPMDADFVADVRFLPNPFWVPELRELRGAGCAGQRLRRGPARGRGVPRRLRPHDRPGHRRLPARGQALRDAGRSAAPAASTAPSRWPRTSPRGWSASASRSPWCIGTSGASDVSRRRRARGSRSTPSPRGGRARRWWPSAVGMAWPSPSGPCAG